MCPQLFKKRVIPKAKEIGADYYKPRATKGDPMEKNKRWINDKMRENRKIYDRGRDPRRTDKERSQRPDFYGMESDAIKKKNYPVEKLED